MCKKIPSFIERFAELLDVPEPRNICEWAEEEVRIDGGKPFRFSYAPHLREMLETPLQKGVSLTVYQVFSRGGKSTVGNLLIGYHIAECPRRILMMRQTIQKAEAYSKSNFTQDFVRVTPALAKCLPEGKSTFNTLRHKVFKGGELRFFGSNAPGDLREAKGNLLIADEIDSYKGNKADEGSILKVFWMRGSEYRDTIQVAMSYPSIEGDSAVASILAQSDCRKYHIPCPHCEREFVPLRKHVSWPEDKPEEAAFHCPLCSKSISDADRKRAIAGGRWVATQPFTGIAGFQAGCMIWPHAVDANKYRSFYHWLADKQLDADASDNPEEANRVLVNTLDALPYRPPALPAPEWDSLRARCEKYDPREMLPEGVLWIAAGVDVQSRWLEITVKGFGEGRQTWALEHRKIEGEIDARDTWVHLLEYLESCIFPHPTLGQVGLLHRTSLDRKPKVFIDSGHKPEIVRAFTKRLEKRGVFACKGSPIVDADQIAGWYRCKTTLASVCKLGVNQLKERVYQALQVADASLDGYCHYPSTTGFDDQYFQGLTVEQAKPVRKDGRIYPRFEAPDGLRNEPLDTDVYARACFAACRPNLKNMERLKYKGSKFARQNIKVIRDGEEVEPDTTPATPATPAKPQTVQPPATKVQPPPPVRKGPRFGKSTWLS